MPGEENEKRGGGVAFSVFSTVVDPSQAFVFSVVCMAIARRRSRRFSFLYRSHLFPEHFQTGWRYCRAGVAESAEQLPPVLGIRFYHALGSFGLPSVS